MYFTPKTNWYGGFYELAIELGSRSDQRLFEALKVLWQHPSLQGCYLNDDVEPNEQKRVSPSPEFLERMHLYGLAQLPDGNKVACGSCIIREDDGSDWLDFYLPASALGEVINLGGYPFDDAGYVYREWQVPLDEWLKDIGKFVYSSISFNLGLVGFEVSGETWAYEIEQKGIPTERHIGYLWSEVSELKWYAPNA